MTPYEANKIIFLNGMKKRFLLFININIYAGLFFGAFNYGFVDYFKLEPVTFLQSFCLVVIITIIRSFLNED